MVPGSKKQSGIEYFRMQRAGLHWAGQGVSLDTHQGMWGTFGQGGDLLAQ